MIGSLFSFVREVSFSHGCAYRVTHLSGVNKTHTRHGRSSKGANPEFYPSRQKLGFRGPTGSRRASPTKFAVLFSIDF
jgi:hypothetical protein